MDRLSQHSANYANQTISNSSLTKCCTGVKWEAFPPMTIGAQGRKVEATLHILDIYLSVSNDLPQGVPSST